ncbi:MAG TPA: DUF2795 domain-containing protein [Mycobacteriales bacterium]|jgi:Protein of unknown function (DUF2795).
MRLTSTDPIKDALSSLDYPASKQRIVEHARRHGALPEAERALSALPLATYRNLAEVLRSVTVEPAPERSESERVYAHRHHRRPGLAEHMRETRLPPVEEALHEDER